MLTRWLPASENKLPPNASHQVGVGAFVLNERREVLVVQVGEAGALYVFTIGGMRAQDCVKYYTRLVVQVRGCNLVLKQGLSALGISIMQLRGWFACSLVQHVHVGCT